MNREKSVATISRVHQTMENALLAYTLGTEQVYVYRKKKCVCVCL